MTDLETLKDMFTRAGIVFDETEPDCITVHAKTGPKNEGYNGFVTQFNFKAGALDTVGAYE